MPNALTLGDMSPRLRKVVGRESPRVTSTEEPDGGNLLVRIWRGAGVGNLPAYSTTAFWRHPHLQRAAPPCPGRRGRPAGAAHSTAERDWRWCWTGVSGWGRVAPQGCPGVKASGRAVGKQRHEDCGEDSRLERSGEFP